MSNRPHPARRARRTLGAISVASYLGLAAVVGWAEMRESSATGPQPRPDDEPDTATGTSPRLGITDPAVFTSERPPTPVVADPTTTADRFVPAPSPAPSREFIVTTTRPRPVNTVAPPTSVVAATSTTTSTTTTIPPSTTTTTTTTTPPTTTVMPSTTIYLGGS